MALLNHRESVGFETRLWRSSTTGSPLVEEAAERPSRNHVPASWHAELMAKKDRCEVPEAYVSRLRAILERLPSCRPEDAWVGTRWRVGSATVAHIFGGEDQRVRLTFRGELDEVHAFRHLGEPYFKAEWGGNVIGLIVDDATDWAEVAELVTDSYCLQAPESMVRKVSRPPGSPTVPGNQ